MLRYSSSCNRIIYSICKQYKATAALKQSPEIYKNWIGSNYSLKGITESLTHPNNISFVNIDHHELGLFRLQRYGQWERAETILKYVENESPLQPTEKMYGFLFMAYLKKEKYEKIISYFDHLQNNNKEILSQYLWNMYLLSLSRSQKTSILLEELKKMEESGIKANEYSYNAIIEGFMITKDYKEVYNTIELMKNNNVPPNEKTYSILVNWYSKQNETKKAIKTISDMKKQDITPNSITYTSLIHGMSINGKQLEGFEWLKKLYKEEIPCDIRAYTTLIKTFDKTRQFGYVIRLWKMLQNDKTIKPSVVVLNYITKILKKSGVPLSEIK